MAVPVHNHLLIWHMLVLLVLSILNAGVTRFINSEYTYTVNMAMAELYGKLKHRMLTVT